MPTVLDPPVRRDVLLILSACLATAAITIFAIRRYCFNHRSDMAIHIDGSNLEIWSHFRVCGFIDTKPQGRISVRFVNGRKDYFLSDWAEGFMFGCVQRDQWIDVQYLISRRVRHFEVTIPKNIDLRFSPTNDRTGSNESPVRIIRVPLDEFWR